MRDLFHGQLERIAFEVGIESNIDHPQFSSFSDHEWPHHGGIYGSNLVNRMGRVRRSSLEINSLNGLRFDCPQTNSCEVRTREETTEATTNSTLTVPRTAKVDRSGLSPECQLEET